MNKTKIVCTIGPASQDEETLRQLIQEGMNVARLNFSHGSHEEQGNKVRLIRKLREEMQIPLAVALDTKGPEIRTGVFQSGEKNHLAEGGAFYAYDAGCGGNSGDGIRFLQKSSARCACRNAHSYR